MAKRIVNHSSITPTATADTTNLANSTYPFCLQGGSGTQRVNVIEVYEGGQAGASSPTFMLLARDTTVGVTTAADAQMNDGPMDASTAALAAPPLVFNKATTAPQRSVTQHLLNLSFNAFGGIVRWVAAPGEEVSIIGNTQPLGEVSLSAFTGGTAGLGGFHMVYEPF